MKNYEKAYKEALERASKIKLRNPIERIKDEIDSIFPELKESEDDRIRKEIISFMTDSSNWYPKKETKASWIAWLEKQGEHIKFLKSIQIGDEVTRNPDGVLVNLSQFKRKAKQGEQINYPQNLQIPNGGIVLEDFNEGEGHYKVHLDYLNEKQVEEIEEMVRVWNKDDENIKACIGMCLTDVNEQRFKDYDTNLRDCLAWLEKKCEQNPTDKAEPKFKIGDYIVYSRNDSLREILYVYDIRDDRYYFNDNVHLSWSIKECDEKCHLWTIQDAKDGDLLANKNGAIFINAGSDESRATLNCYCYISVQGEFCIEEHKTGSWLYKTEIYPATKEQRDLLFSKIKEAGYKWDAEKKELKKIDLYSTAWNEEDEEMLEDTISCLSAYRSPDISKGLCYQEQIDWLKSLKDSVQHQPKQEWNKDDEKYISHIISILEGWDREHACSIPSVVPKCIDWLKSLRPNHWKPSKEQMEALNAINTVGELSYAGQADLLIRLYNDLEKL